VASRHRAPHLAIGRMFRDRRSRGKHSRRRSVYSAARGIVRSIHGAAPKYGAFRGISARAARHQLTNRWIHHPVLAHRVNTGR
jgi:hypothetical protein